MLKIELKLLSLNKYLFIGGMTLFAIFSMIFILFLLHILGVELPERQEEEINFWYFALYLIAAPLLETLLFQRIPINFLWKYFEKDWPLAVISAMLFAAAHYLNEFFISDVLMLLMIGWVYAYAYIIAKKRIDMNAYWSVVLIHAGYNLFAVLVDLLVD